MVSTFCATQRSNSERSLVFFACGLVIVSSRLRTIHEFTQNRKADAGHRPLKVGGDIQPQSVTVLTSVTVTPLWQIILRG